MAIFDAQLTCLITLLVGNFIIGTSPFFFVRIFLQNDRDECRRKRVLTFLTYFGGGVFMSICFLNLQPRAHEEYEKRQQLPQQISTDNEHEHTQGFPIPEFVILCSFFAMFAIEEILQFIFIGHQRKPLIKEKKIPFCSCAKRHTECNRTYKAAYPTEQTLYGVEKNLADSDKGCGLEEYLGTARERDSTANRENKLLQSAISQPVPNYGAMANITQINQNQPIPNLTLPIVFDENGKMTLAQSPPLQIDYRPSATYLLLAITISCYDIFQGISIGHLGAFFTWVHFVECMQQFIVSFVVGSIILPDIESSLAVTCYIGMLSIMCPLGVSATMIFDNALKETSHLAQALTSATLCGSFLYLTFFDLLRGDALHNTPSLGKFIFFTTGTIVVTALQYINVTI